MKPRIHIMMFVLAIILSGCSFISSLNSLRTIEFGLSSINSVSLGGIALQGKSKVTDLSVGETITLAGKVAEKNVPLAMTLNLQAKNPNDSDQYNLGNATIQSIEWRLIIDDVPTIQGVIQGPIELPGNGAITTIPLAISFNLFDFFENRGFDGIKKLVFALAHDTSSSVSIVLDAKPTITTKLGQMTYPGRITIAKKTFN